MLIKVNKEILREVFYFLTAVILLLVVAEVIWPNSVLVYINLNYVVIIWILTWLLLL